MGDYGTLALISMVVNLEKKFLFKKAIFVDVKIELNFVKFHRGTLALTRVVPNVMTGCQPMVTLNIS